MEWWTVCSGSEVIPYCLWLSDRRKVQKRVAGYLQTIATASSTAIAPALYIFSDDGK